MSSYSSSFENYLTEVLAKQTNNRTTEAMAYSLLGGGKRIRPRLLWSIANNYGATIQDELIAAAAIEMIHCYSLVHDDLPAMDDDDLRRGKQTCHIKFNQATAILAGDGLLTLAFEEISKLPVEMIAPALEIVTKYSGNSGMIAGQDLDINNVVDSWQRYTELAELKTGCLFVAALTLGALICKQTQLNKPLIELGFKLGLAFQIQDDILEAENSSTITGKSSSDVRNKKKTAVSLIGLAKAKVEFHKIYNEILLLLDKLPRKLPALKQLIEDLLERDF